MLRVLLPLFVILVFVRFYFRDSPGMQPAGSYPVWLRDSNENQTKQTSGLCFVGNKDGRKVFISCDDIGAVHRIEIDESGPKPVLFITPVEFSAQVKELFAKFKKTDMEEIVYDKGTEKIFLVIEGHEYSSLDPMVYKKKEGVYEITFNKDIFSFDTLLTIKRLVLPEAVYQFTHDNIGFEGFAATERFFYLGLENFQKEGNQFSDSTYLYVMNRESKELKVISTRESEVSSISGLAAISDKVVYGIDRNRRQLFRMEFDDKHELKSIRSKQLDLPVPGHPEINNITGIAPEAITFDDKGDIYIATDPWLAFYKPDLAQRRLLSEEELFFFSKEVPMLYKYKDELK